MGGRGRIYAVFLALAAVMVSALAPPSYAGGCPPTASVSYSYAAPAVSYSSYSYAAPAVKTVYQTQKVYVPYAVKAVVSPDFYSSSQDYYRDKILVDAVAGKTAEALKLQEELSQLRQQVQTYQQLQMQWQLQQQQQQQQQYQPSPPAYQQPPPPQQPPYPPQHSPAPQRMPPAYGQGGSYHGGPQQQVQGHGGVPAGLDQVVANSCIRCHGGGSGHQGGGLDLRDLARVPWETRLLCHSEVCNGTMPRGGQQLSPEQTALFYEWAQAGRGALAQR